MLFHSTLQIRFSLLTLAKIGKDFFDALTVQRHQAF